MGTGIVAFGIGAEDKITEDTWLWPNNERVDAWNYIWADN